MPPNDDLSGRHTGEWPIWEVGVYGFGDFYVQAPTKASARWWTASQMHEAGYGRTPVELIQRGVTVRQVSRVFAGLMGDIHRVMQSPRETMRRSKRKGRG